MSKLKLRSRGAFTLIELLVVIVIIAILMAVAIPTFLNQRQKAQNSSAQQTITNTYLEAKSIYTDSSSYPTATAAINAFVAQAQSDEPSLNIMSGDAVANPTDTTDTFISFVNSQEIIVSRNSQDGSTFSLQAIEQSTAGAPGVTRSSNWYSG